MAFENITIPDYGIIDAHMHPLLSGDRPDHPFHIPDDYGEFFAEQQKAGISVSCGSFITSSRSGGFEVIRQCNERVMELYRERPEEFLPGINVHPDFPELSCLEIARCHEAGCRVVGELAGYIMGYDRFNSPGMFQIFEEAQSRDMLISLHPTSLEDITGVAENFPKAKIMLAHPGGMKGIVKNFELLNRFPNLYFDLSGTGLFRWGMLRYGVDKVGSDRILFGTDFPICNSGMNVFGVLFENLSDAERRRILRTNFIDLTGYPLPR